MILMRGSGGGGELGGSFLVLVLKLVELEVEAVLGEELLVGALFAELTFVHDEDGVRALDGAKAVGDEGRWCGR